MTGMQYSAWDAIQAVAANIKDGKYGKDDDFDTAALEGDLEETVGMLW